MVLHPSANIIPLAGVELNSSPAINVWMQSYDPARHWWLSTFWAALPLVVLLVAMIGLRLKGHISALIALAVALVIAVAVFHMGTLIGWLGTASTGSDTSANVLFGSLQKFTPSNPAKIATGH